MSEFSNKTVRAIESGLLYTVTDTIDAMFGECVVLTDENGDVALIQKIEAFRNEGLYEIVEE